MKVSHIFLAKQGYIYQILNITGKVYLPGSRVRETVLKGLNKFRYFSETEIKMQVLH